MKHAAARAGAAAGLLLAVLAPTVAVRAWLGERALARGRELQAHGDFLGAAGRYEEALRHGRPAAAAELARLALLRRRWDEAAAYARRALARAPAEGSPHAILAAAALARPGAWDRQREEEVLGACRTAVRLAPMVAGISRACGETALALLAARGDSWDARRRDEVLEEAAARFARAVELSPRTARATLAAALARGAPPRILVRAAAAGEGRGPLAAAVGLLIERGQWDAAAAPFRAAGEAAADRRFPLAAADALARAGRVEEALAATGGAVAATPGDAEAWFAHGQLLRRAKRADEARAALRRAAELAPDNAAYRRAAGG